MANKLTDRRSQANRKTKRLTDRVEQRGTPIDRKTDGQNGANRKTEDMQTDTNNRQWRIQRGAYPARASSVFGNRVWPLQRQIGTQTDQHIDWAWLLVLKQSSRHMATILKPKLWNYWCRYCLTMVTTPLTTLWYIIGLENQVTSPNLSRHQMLSAVPTLQIKCLLSHLKPSWSYNSYVMHQM